jgi:SpoIID/LytB domain protein
MRPSALAHRLVVATALGSALFALARPAAAEDETSAGDKLRILYSSRFTFTEAGDPLVTVEIMGGQRQVSLEADGGLVVRPDGDGGAEVTGGASWTVTLEGGRPATVREWTIVARLPASDPAAVDAALATWKAKNKSARAFETGTVFAVAGAVMDTRAMLIGIDPVAPGQGDARARAVAKQYGVATHVHAELTARPRGTVIATGGGVAVENRSVLWFAPRRPGATIVVRDVVTGAGGSQLTTGRQDRRYAGQVYVAVGRDGKLTVVNAIGAEKLLAGLVPSEMFPASPPAALAAQAIAARTDLLHKLGTRHLEDPFLVCSSQHCQVYGGAGREDRRTDEAIAATRGKVLVREAGGGLIDVRYSADCGGHGEHKETIWGGDPDPVLRGKRDAPVADRFSGAIGEREVASFVASDDAGSYCGGGKHAKGRHRWTARLDPIELGRRVGEEQPVGRVLALEPLARGVSGRITKLRVRGDRGSATIVGDLKIRRLLGGLRSSLFVVATEGDRAAPSAFVLTGAGFGHGVGMCQVGAIGMAERRKSVSQILGHYFPGAAIHALY